MLLHPRTFLRRSLLIPVLLVLFLLLSKDFSFCSLRDPFGLGPRPRGERAVVAEDGKIDRVIAASLIPMRLPTRIGGCVLTFAYI